MFLGLKDKEHASASTFASTAWTNRCTVLNVVVFASARSTGGSAGLVGTIGAILGATRCACLLLRVTGASDAEALAFLDDMSRMIGWVSMVWRKFEGCLCELTNAGDSGERCTSLASGSR